jgi:ribokinase
MGVKILFYGDIATDLVIRTEAVPDDGHDASIQDLDLKFGGSSANSAAVAASLGAEAYYMGFVGDDLYSELLIEDLKKNNVKTNLVRQMPGKSTMIVAMINKSGDRTMLSYRGVNAEYSYKTDFDQLVKSFDAIHISGYCLQDKHSKETALNLVKAANKYTIPLSIDPSYLSSHLDSDEFSGILEKLTYLFPNRSEAIQITKSKDLQKQLQLLEEKGIRYPILKLDEQGCAFANKELLNGFEILPAYPQKNLVNAVGAGDAFCAGFLYAHLQGLSLAQSAKIGNAAAHIVLEGKGGRDHLPSKERMKKVFSPMDQSLVDFFFN